MRNHAQSESSIIAPISGGSTAQVISDYNRQGVAVIAYKPGKISALVLHARQDQDDAIVSARGFY